MGGRDRTRDVQSKEWAVVLVVSLRGCKSRSLVLVRVTRRKRHYFLAIKVSLRVQSIIIIVKNAVIKSGITILWVEKAWVTLRWTS